MQLHLPKDKPGWSEIVEACVTPWDEVTESDKQLYYTNFGENAPPPDGMFVESRKAKCMGQIGTQGYVGYSTRPGMLIIVR